MTLTPEARAHLKAQIQGEDEPADGRLGAETVKVGVSTVRSLLADLEAAEERADTYKAELNDLMPHKVHIELLLKQRDGLIAGMKRLAALWQKRVAMYEDAASGFVGSPAHWSGATGRAEEAKLCTEELTGVIEKGD